MTKFKEELEKILEKFRYVEWIMTNDKDDDDQRIKNRLAQALSSILSLIKENLPKEKYLIDNLPLKKSVDYVDKCVEAKIKVGEFNSCLAQVKGRLGII